MSETCSTCRFFDPVSRHPDDGVEEGEAGYCRAHPRHVLIGPDHWCGEYVYLPARLR